VNEPRIRDAGDAAVVVELGDGIDAAVNARAIALAARLRDEAIDGVRDVVATFRSVAVFFDPRRTDVDALKARVRDVPDANPAESAPPAIEVPVEYGGDAGPDLDALAAAAGLSSPDVIARHSGRAYRVFMVGFLPGFAYLGPVDTSIAAPRHATPRLRVSPGSVGIAGQQTGVYPQASPGGWQIIGRTATRPFDARRSPPSLFAAGGSVRFVPVPRGSLDFDAAWTAPPSPPHAAAGGRSVTVMRPGLMTTVQDEGRWGSQHDGVPVSGAMDGVSLHGANGAVGNAAGDAAIEVTLGGAELRLDHAGTLAVSGADLDATLDGQAIALNARVTHAAGSVVRFGMRRRGTRAYLALQGGIAVPPCLGSRATDLTSGLGGSRLRADDRLPVGEPPRDHAAAAAPIGARAVPAGNTRTRAQRWIVSAGRATKSRRSRIAWAIGCAGPRLCRGTRAR
jgi:KipI family sensor histidine kinase inhibitor